MRVSESVLAVLIVLLFATPTAAHEPKEYTMLLKEEGVTPNGVQDGILVSTDYLFFYNVDKRENASHRILIDADSDGIFNGSDDISTAWLHPSCELNETGQRTDPDCQVTELVLLDPSNGLLPGNISMMHQVSYNGSTDDSSFFVSFSNDEHATQPAPNNGMEQEIEDDSADTTLKAVLLLSLIGIVAILPRLLSED